VHPERTGPTPTPTATPEDHFDAWLDAFVAGPSTPAATASPSPGMPSEPAFDAARSAARQLHDLAQAADLAQSRVHPSSTRSPVPTWEELLMSSPAATTTTTPMPVPIPFPAGRTHRSRPATMETINRILTIAAIVAIVLAGIATAWVARDRLGFSDGHQPTLQLVATAATAPDCTVTAISEENAARLVAQRQPRQVSDYLPVSGPASPTAAMGAIETIRARAACHVPSDTTTLYRTNLQTDKTVAIWLATQTDATRPAIMEESRNLMIALSPALLTGDATSYTVDPTDPAVAPYVFAFETDPSVHYALLPQDFVELADGRIGAPLKTATSHSASGTAGDPASVIFLIFKDVNGRWLEDDYVWLCADHCDALFTQAPSSALVATPATSPEATPQT